MSLADGGRAARIAIDEADVGASGRELQDALAAPAPKGILGKFRRS